MTPEKWKEIQRLYFSSIEKEPDKRLQFLAESGADEEIRREVASLLAHRENGSSLLERYGLDVAAEMIIKSHTTSLVGRMIDHHGLGPSACSERWLPNSIGKYRILRHLGEGNMGIVYEAQQEQPRRKVALKVIKPGLASSELLRRFEQEAEALGRLQHPGIAQIYEAGWADTGFGPQPYFALEFIRGRTLGDFVRERNLSVREKLELVAKVADAVHHAHQRGLIHRDLKPANILVDETGQPKVLDFGVARVTDRGAPSTVQTDVGQIVGTLAYMSPEQVLGDPLEIDTRSDVYALGVILYELLAERQPYNTGTKLHEAIQVIRGQ